MTTAGGIPGLAPGVSDPIRSAEATAHRAPRTFLRSPGATAHRALRTLLLGGLLAAPCAASQVPSPAQAQSALQQAVQQNPGLPDMIRQRLQQSGLTAEQVRARLSASGYAPNLLDAYLGAAAPGQVAPDYRLGAGDQLVLILTGDVELAYTLQVTREGFMLIPQVGQVFVSNLTLDQLRDVLFARLGRVYSGVKRGPGATTRFDITVANVRANQVYVVGEVTQPGAYQISSLGTALTAWYAAGGGFRPDAALQRVSVYRILAPTERGPGSPPRAVIDISLTPLTLGKGERGKAPPGDPPLPVSMPTLALEDGDSVVVDAVKPLA